MPIMIKKLRSLQPQTWPAPLKSPMNRGRPGRALSREIKDRRFDTTALTESGCGARVHRDYAAHWFRWGAAVNRISHGQRVLDVGCGKDQPLVKALCYKLTLCPSHYLGVDLNHIKKKTRIAWATVEDETSFVDEWPRLKKQYGGEYDVVTCFEVIEHMKVEDGRKLLEGVREMMASDALFMLSTPVYNERHMAAAHIHEYRFGELRQEIYRAGFKIERVFGTFMTAQAAKRSATPPQRTLLDELHEYYAWDVLANFLAPLYPEASSNCCWFLRRRS